MCDRALWQCQDHFGILTGNKARLALPMLGVRLYNYLLHCENWWFTETRYLLLRGACRPELIVSIKLPTKLSSCRTACYVMDLQWERLLMTALLLNVMLLSFLQKHTPEVVLHKKAVATALWCIWVVAYQYHADCLLDQASCQIYLWSEGLCNWKGRSFPEQCGDGHTGSWVAQLNFI